MTEWNAMTYDGKDTILRVVRDEAEAMFALAERPEAWERPTTSCPGWSTRDVVAHIIDTTEGYFSAFDAAHGTGSIPEQYGLTVMSEKVNEKATAFRGTPQSEMMDRLRADFHKMQEILDPIGPEGWSGFMVTHPYMGPVPAFFYAAGQLMDYGVHSWDVRQGTGRAHGLAGEVGDLLVPFMFVLWKYTVGDSDPEPCELGIRITSGPSAGDTRVTVGPGGMDYAPGDISDLTTIEFDPGSFVLTAFGRSNAGSVRGDRLVADRYLNLFFRI